MLLNKTCDTCKATLPVRFFYKNKGAKDGYKNKCKLCCNDMAKAKSFNVEKYYEKNGKYYLKKIRSFIRDSDEATNDIRDAYNIKPTRLINIWSQKREDE